MRFAYSHGIGLLKSVVWLAFIPTLAYADEIVEFDPSFFDFGGQVIDVSRFSQKDYVPAGQYNVDVFVNGELRGRADIEYVETADGKTALCLTSKLVQLFDLKKEALGVYRQNSCQNPSEYLPDAKIKLDQSVLALRVEIPQALLMLRPRGYVPPQLWSNGVPAAFANYAFGMHRHFGNWRNNYSQHLYLNGGINVGGWAVRHTGSFHAQNGKRSHYSRGTTYLKTGIAPLNSELTLGDFITEGVIVDGVPLRGAMMRTDVRMLPQTQRGYAPRITGVANTNATVIVRQKNNVIYQINVPAGLFEINDLYPTGFSGELSVEIHEADGNVKKTTVPYATLVPLMRVGQLKYQLAAGVYRHGNNVWSDDRVLTGSMQYGLTNRLTVNGGFIGHRHYQSQTAGLAMNTKYGAISGDVTTSSAKLGNARAERGASVRASYSLYVTPTKTNITLANYRYFSRGYYSFDETVAVNRLQSDDDGAAKIQEWRTTSVRPKNRYQLTLAQELKSGWGSLYFSGAMSNYWNYRGNHTEYQLSYANHYKSLSYHLGIAQSHAANDPKSDGQIFASLSFPLDLGWSNTPDKRNRFGHLNVAYAQDWQGRRQLRESVYASAGEYGQYGYGVSLAQSDHHTALAANASYRGNKGSVDASVAIDSDHTWQYSIGATGAVVAHPKGVTLSDSVGDTFGIIHAKEGAGAKINNGVGKRLDRFGNAIVEHLTPYEYNRLGIDPVDLPMNIEFDSTEREVVPKANAAMLIDLKASKNTMVLFHIDSADFDIPMGVSAVDEQGNVVGYVVQGDMLYANRLQRSDGTIRLKWGDSPLAACQFDYQLPVIKQQDVMQNIEVKCLASKQP